MSFLKSHNLSTVVKFEFTRTIKKKTFWFMIFGFPIIIAAIAGIVFFSNKSTSEQAEKLGSQKFSIQIMDQSGLILPELIDQIGAKSITDRDEGINAVKNSSLDAFIYYPKDFSRNQIEIYAKNVGIFNNGRYTAVASSLLSNSINPKIEPNIKIILSNSYHTNLSTFEDGVLRDPSREIILPGIFLVLFYLLIAFFGNQMLTSTTEEKENRVIEMILTTIEARVLITGKIIALMLLALLQAFLLIIPALTIYFIMHKELGLPDLNNLSASVEPLRILFGLLIFIFSFGLFTGLLVLIGAAMPTAKEANQFFGIIMMAIFGPLYAAPLFISSPDNILVQFLSFFPITAPIPLLLRNATGTLPPLEAIIGIVVLAISMFITLNIATHVFQYGALEYNRRVSIKEIFSRK